MVRYLQQKDSFRCGPVALANIMKWAGIKEFEGHRINERTVKGYLSTRCRTTKEGTDGNRIFSLIRVLPGITTRLIKSPKITLRDINKCLNTGGIVLLAVDNWWVKVTRVYEGHFAIILRTLGFGNDYYEVLNDLNPTWPTNLSAKTKHQIRTLIKKKNTEVLLIWKKE